MNYRAFLRTAEAVEPTEFPEQDNSAPPACSYCGGVEFEAPEDNGRVMRAECSACHGTMVSHGGSWMPDLIGQPDNHPKGDADPRSGGVGGAANAPVKMREEDLSSRTAAVEDLASSPTITRGMVLRQGVWHPEERDRLRAGQAHPHDLLRHLDRRNVGDFWHGHAYSLDDAKEYAEHDSSDHVGHEANTDLYNDDDERGHVGEVGVVLEAHRPRGWDPNKNPANGLMGNSYLSHPTDLHLHKIHYNDHEGNWHSVDASGYQVHATGFDPEQTKHYGATDWCRHRHGGHCWLPRQAPAGGVALYVPQDRGVCPWTTPQTQQINCPVSEPGPMAGMTVNASITDTSELAFHFLATWRDVRAKAARIRRSGGVQILSSLADGLTGHVQGDTGIYETQINYVPGSFKVGHWQCGCAWAAYAWGRSKAYRRFEGRMCSHALALQYEAQSRGMFGREVREDTQRPDWLRDKVRVRYDRSQLDHDVREASAQAGLDPDGVYPTEHGLSLDRRPIEVVATVAWEESGDPAAALQAMLAVGVEHRTAKGLLHELSAGWVNLPPPVSTTAASAPTPESNDDPTHAGVVLKAQDTGRVLMIQRSNKDEDDPARGKWEFPGGGREEGDQHSLHSGIREFEEEVGHPFPTGGHVTHVWRSGPYQGHVVVVPNEDSVDFSGGRRTVNPDDPDGDDHEQSAWWHPEDARKNPALRDECKTSPWGEIKKAALLVTAVAPADPRQHETCPKCHAQNPKGQAGCRDCGYHLNSERQILEAESALHTADYAANDALHELGPGWRPKPPAKPMDGSEENPASTGWATAGDPPEWDQAQNSPSLAPLTSWSTLHDAPEPALPSTDGAEDVVETPGERYRAQMTPEISGDDLTPSDGRTASVSDIVARFQATAAAASLQTTGGGASDMDIAEAARAHLAGRGIQRTALKDFGPTERHALITEGTGARARNYGDLQIEGTHYAALEEALAHEHTLDATDLFA